MIDEIQVENLALIREAALEPARGLTVLTGETGAGKTALLSALKLLMGARADKDSVRDGEDALAVSGRFFGIAALGDGQDDAVADDLVVSRRVTSDG
ncbi:AAA family ATPase, partial [Paraeggerthella sp.]